MSFDFHMEPIATLFLLLAGRELWRGRNRRAWYFVAGVLLCGSFAAIMLVGLGVSALLAGAATRRAGTALVLTGVAWTLLIALLGANRGSGLSDYAYLAGRTTLPAGGVLLIAKGVLRHPSRALDKLFDRYPYYWAHLRPVGVVGLASSWGVGVPVVVMGVDALVAQPNFSSSAFQNFAVLPFVLLGTVMSLVWLGMRYRRGRAAGRGRGRGGDRVGAHLRLHLVAAVRALRGPLGARGPRRGAAHRPGRHTARRPGDRHHLHHGPVLLPSRR